MTLQGQGRVTRIQNSLVYTVYVQIYDGKSAEEPHKGTE